MCTCLCIYLNIIIVYEMPWQRKNKINLYTLGLYLCTKYLYLRHRKIYILLKSGKNVAELFSVVGWKVELLSDELRQLAEDISHRSVKDAAQLLLTAYGKSGEKRYSEKEQELDDLENYRPIQVVCPK